VQTLNGPVCRSDLKVQTDSAGSISQPAWGAGANRTSALRQEKQLHIPCQMLLGREKKSNHIS
jgi:hypothetical protein